MLEIRFDLTEFEEVEIVPIADVHMGSPLCNEAELKRVVDYILEEPEDPKCARICLLNGDLTESATKTNRNGNVFEQTMTPAVQVATMLKYLRPLAETSKKYPMGKILSFCAGNHDGDRYKETGISAAESIAVGLHLEDRFSENGCYSYIMLNVRGSKTRKDKMITTLYNQHGSGNAGTVGGKANRVAKISNGIIADVICSAHTHTPLTFKEDIIVPNTVKMVLRQKTITYLICSAFLRYGDYAQKGGMKPSTIAMPRVFIRQGRKMVNYVDDRFTYTEVIL